MLPKIAMIMRPRWLNEAAPARVQNDRAPKDDQDRAVFFRVPAPETAPRLIGPDAAEHGADEAEERGKTNHAVGHARERIGRLLFQRAGEDAADDINDREHSGEEHGRITGGDRDHVRGQPDVGVEHGLQHFEGVAAAGEMMRDDQRDETNRARAGRADAVPKNSLEDQRHDDRAPADENGGRIKIRDRRPFLQIHPRDQAEGVNGKREQQKIKRRAIQRPAPAKPGDASEQEREHVKRHAVA